MLEINRWFSGTFFKKNNRTSVNDPNHPSVNCAASQVGKQVLQSNKEQSEHNQSSNSESIFRKRIKFLNNNRTRCERKLRKMIKRHTDFEIRQLYIKLEKKIDSFININMKMLF